jgi:hypothetical protein
MGDSNTTFENNEITTGSANYEFKFGTDNPFYNYEYSECPYFIIFYSIIVWSGVLTINGSNTGRI